MMNNNNLQTFADADGNISEIRNTARQSKIFSQNRSSQNNPSVNNSTQHMLNELREKRDKFIR
jgi:hypothetical protein